MIVFLVEDYSMRQFLDGILPRLGFDEHIFEIKHHRGKEDLISHLDKIIPSLSKRAQQIIVIIDQDKQDCVALKNEIKEKMAWCFCEYKIRIACYELEAWFLGDMAAIAKCSPRFKARSFQGKKKYRDVDNIEKPSTVIAKIVPDWNDKYASKPKFAQTIAQFVSLERQNLKQANRSNSFHVLLETLFSLARE
jgi:chromosomal replication initiation ATPase DnaA